MKKGIYSRTVIILALVSLLTDISSEMLYPVMPLFLQSLGFSVVWIGILEGTAQVFIGLSIGFFGRWSDQIGKRMPFITGGYLLSTLAKPVMGLFANLPVVFFARVSERFGKGIRTGARDALLADESQDLHRGKVFGFHRSMDTLGAAIGPVIALVYLAYHPGDYKTLFLLAFLPGIVAVLFTCIIREVKIQRTEARIRPGFFDFIRYWKIASPEYKKISLGFFLFALFNSSDAFLFLIAKEQGISDQNLILAYVLYNFIYAVLAVPAGSLADRFGMKPLIVFGLILFVLCYAGFAVLSSAPFLYLLFVAYGIYGACHEGISKAWLAKNCAETDRGTAMGFYRSFVHLFLLPASLLTGWIWVNWGSAQAMLFSALGGLLAITYFLTFSPIKKHR